MPSEVSKITEVLSVATGVFKSFIQNSIVILDVRLFNPPVMAVCIPL
jgi:hypothetical protein